MQLNLLAKPHKYIGQSWVDVAYRAAVPNLNLCGEKLTTVLVRNCDIILNNRELASIILSTGLHAWTSWLFWSHRPIVEYASGSASSNHGGMVVVLISQLECRLSRVNFKLVVHNPFGKYY